MSVDNNKLEITENEGKVLSNTRASLRRVGNQVDEKINLAKTALLLARLDAPHKDINAYLNHLKDIQSSVKAYFKRNKISKPSLAEKVEALKHVILKEFRYTCHHRNFDGLEYADFITMIDNRKAHPLSLGVLFIEIAKRLNWHVEAMNFPGHFLLRFADKNKALVMDPFHEGRILDAVQLRGLVKIASGLDAEIKPSYYNGMSNRDILLRLQNCVKLRQIRNGNMGRAAEVVDTMLWIAPDSSSVWYEGALLQARKGCLNKAKDMLENSLKCARSENDKNQIFMMLQQIHQRFH